jgi:hypothetical protein
MSFQGSVYLGQNVNRSRCAIIFPTWLFAAHYRIAKKDLQTCGKWHVFHAFFEAPAGRLGEPVNIARKPAGAV